MKRFLFASILSASLLAPMSVIQLAAQTPESRIHHRRDRQQARIGQGVASGQLTPREGSRMERQQAHLNRKIARERTANGGRLTPAEKRQINRQQNRDSRRIYRQKHDAQAVQH